MKRKKTRYRRQRAGRSPVLRRYRSEVIRPVQLRIRINMGVYQQVAGVRQEPALKLRFIGYGFVFLLLVLLLTGAVRLGYGILEESGTFVVRRITVLGNRMSNEAEILSLADIRRGTHLFDFDTEAVAERVRQHLWIDQAAVERVWPDALTIRVYEHRPLALLNIEQKKEHGEEALPGLYYVDHHGIIFSPVDRSQRLDFPVVTGFVPPERAGEKEALSGLDLADTAGDAYQFLQLAALGNPILPLQSISEINVQGEKGIVVYLVERPFPIYVGCGNVKSRYYQLVKLLALFYRKNGLEGIRAIRMDYQAGRILVARTEP
ncbi:MAG: cell division protein FtsQ/DivIB [Candidatus Electrothrix sp. YB6]